MLDCSNDLQLVFECLGLGLNFLEVRLSLVHLRSDRDQVAELDPALHQLPRHLGRLQEWLSGVGKSNRAEQTKLA